jgi:sulfate adenylyltransferase subunit 1 (EFTu-like GTPase family)
MAAKIKVTTIQTRLTERRYDGVQKKSNVITSVLAHREEKVFVTHYRTIQTFESKAGDTNVQLETANEQLVSNKQRFASASQAFNLFNAVSVRMANEFGLRRGKEIEGFDSLDPEAMSKNVESLFQMGHQSGFAEAQSAARAHFVKMKTQLDESRALVESLEAKLDATVHELETRVYLARLDLIRAGIDIPKPVRKKKEEEPADESNSKPNASAAAATAPSATSTAAPTPDSVASAA